MNDRQKVKSEFGFSFCKVTKLFHCQIKDSFPFYQQNIMLTIWIFCHYSRIILKRSSPFFFLSSYNQRFLVFGYYDMSYIEGVGTCIEKLTAFLTWWIRKVKPGNYECWRVQSNLRRDRGGWSPNSVHSSLTDPWTTHTHMWYRLKTAQLKTKDLKIETTTKNSECLEKTLSNTQKSY